MKLKTKLQWVAIFGLLLAFTAEVGVTYAQGNSGFINHGLDKYRSNVVYFEDRRGHFTKEQYVCAISTDQLAAIQGSYSVQLQKRHEHGHTYTVAIVTVGKHQNDKQLKSIVGAEKLGRCQERSCHNLFYIFTVPELS